MILHYLSGPLIGAVIGYCTNYIAVKMLFYPRKEIRIFGHRLPFTPGAIPKGQARLARAAGSVVGTTLFTEEDVAARLLNPETENKVVDGLSALMAQELKQEVLTLTGAEEQTYEETKEKLSALLCRKIIDALLELQIGDMIAAKGGEMIKEKLQGSFMGMFMSGNAVRTMTDRIGEEVQRILEEEGEGYIRPVIDGQLTRLEDTSAAELLQQMDVSPQRQEELIRSTYDRLVRQGVGVMFRSLNIAQVVEDKINGMDIGELERLVLQVMKKELNTIVNLGALVGFILGLVNLLI